MSKIIKHISEIKIGDYVKKIWPLRMAESYNKDKGIKDFTVGKVIGLDVGIRIKIIYTNWKIYLSHNDNEFTLSYGSDGDRDSIIEILNDDEAMVWLI